MNSRYYKIGVALIAVLFVVGFSGCILEAVKYTGGGTIASAQQGCDDGATANFGFVLNNCGDEIKGGLTYHDQYYELKENKLAYRCEDFNDKFTKQALAQGVKFTAEWTGAASVISMVGFADFDYASQNPFCRGTGEGFAWVVDNGEGAEASPDLICIKIASGPFKNYENCGFFGQEVQGNIQEHDCPPAGAPE